MEVRSKMIKARIISDIIFFFGIMSINDLMKKMDPF